jgi:hypothetical protein
MPSGVIPAGTLELSAVKLAPEELTENPTMLPVELPLTVRLAT